MAADSYVLGIDIGTSGVKALVVDRGGAVVARGAAGLPAPVAVGNRREQDANLWWAAAIGAIHHAVRELRAAGGAGEAIVAVAVDATSGTVVPVDKTLRPLCPGLMYNDGRAVAEASRLNEIGATTLDRLGYRFNASFGLAKILWLHQQEPRVMENASLVLHQSDYLTARLADLTPADGAILTDESNSLKSGYDILDRRWPDYLSDAGIDAGKLPGVAAIGAPIGKVGRNMAAELGLSPDCEIVGGMSDGTAACAASGARRVGDMNTTLGTTVVWKTITSQLVKDAAGRLYSHRHPGGAFLPGGAGNAGGEGIRRFAAGDATDAGARLGRLAAALTPGAPSGAITYPLPAPGERFPFVDSDFAPFTTAGPEDEGALYRSCLEGVACIERWGYEVAAELGAECGGEVWTAGKGAEIDPWMQIRADTLGRPVCRAAHPESGFGSALVAAMNSWFGGSWEETVAQMNRETFRCEPDASRRQAYEDMYGRFRAICEERRGAGEASREEAAGAAKLPSKEGQG